MDHGWSIMLITASAAPKRVSTAVPTRSLVSSRNPYTVPTSHSRRPELGAGERDRPAAPSLSWMVATHGVANATGFVLCALLAWRRLAATP
jgi:hypothetical protein